VAVSLLQRWETGPRPAGGQGVLPRRANPGSAKVAHRARNCSTPSAHPAPHVRLLYQCSPYHIEQCAMAGHPAGSRTPPDCNEGRLETTSSSTIWRHCSCASPMALAADAAPLLGRAGFGTRRQPRAMRPLAAGARKAQTRRAPRCRRWSKSCTGPGPRSSRCWSLFEDIQLGRPDAARAARKAHWERIGNASKSTHFCSRVEKETTKPGGPCGRRESAAETGLGRARRRGDRMCGLGGQHLGRRDAGHHRPAARTACLCSSRKLDEGPLAGKSGPKTSVSGIAARLA